MVSGKSMVVVFNVVTMIARGREQERVIHYDMREEATSMMLWVLCVSSCRRPRVVVFDFCESLLAIHQEGASHPDKVKTSSRQNSNKQMKY